MAETAKVESIDALKSFKRALIKFAQAASVALGDAESEIHRAQLWLETEQRSHWTHQVRLRTEIVARAKEAVRMKKLFKDAAGSRQSAVEEEKALQIAQRKLAEAETKVIAVRRYLAQLQKDYHVFKGSIQRFATAVEVDVPTAAHKLDALTRSLEAYVSAAPTVQGSTSQPTEPAPMARPDADVPMDESSPARGTNGRS
jgi:hypothetical protein